MLSTASLLLIAIALLRHFSTLHIRAHPLLTPIPSSPFFHISLSLSSLCSSSSLLEVGLPILLHDSPHTWWYKGMVVREIKYLKGKSFFVRRVLIECIYRVSVHYLFWGGGLLLLFFFFFFFPLKWFNLKFQHILTGKNIERAVLDFFSFLIFSTTTSQEIQQWPWGFLWPPTNKYSLVGISKGG